MAEGNGGREQKEVEEARDTSSRAEVGKSTVERETGDLVSRGSRTLASPGDDEWEERARRNSAT